MKTLEALESEPYLTEPLSYPVVIPGLSSTAVLGHIESSIGTDRFLAPWFEVIPLLSALAL